jgi:hypothetical protein
LLQQDSSQQKERTVLYPIARGGAYAASQSLQPIIAGFSEISDNPELRDARTLIA